MAALLAQGLNRVEVASAAEISPEYVTWLGGDPLFRGYVKEMAKLADVQLEALFPASVDAIADQLRFGSGEEKLKAARLTMEATGRVGKGSRRFEEDEEPSKLEELAKRLINLQRGQRGQVLEGESTVVSETS